MKPKVGQPVEVRWVDSSSLANWQSDAEVERTLEGQEHHLRIRSVGYVYRSTKASLSIYQSLDEDGQSKQHFIRIPRVAVLSVKKLRKV